ncbi:CoA pyrophosphatase [Rhodoferax aquaticus]
MWTPEIPGEPAFTNKALVPAAVLIPLVLRAELMVLLTQRPNHMSSHPGQIAFPGGKSDPVDESPIDTALRETAEEVGIESRYVEVLGTLPQYTTGSGFAVTPVVGVLRDGFIIAPNALEVSEVFEVPFSFLMNPANHRRHAMEWLGVSREWFSMPYCEEQTERFIWGATAGMLRNLYSFLSV